MAVTQNELITALQTLLSTNPVRLAMRSGTAASLNLADLVVGEIAVATDTLQVWVCTALGTVIQLTGLNLLGYYATSGALATAHPTGTAGQVYAVGSAPAHLYTWGASSWTDLGAMNDVSTFATTAALSNLSGTGRTTEAVVHIGLLASLLTTAKTNLVAAVNELFTLVQTQISALASKFYSETVTFASVPAGGSATLTINYPAGFTQANSALVALTLSSPTTMWNLFTLFSYTSAGNFTIVIFNGAGSAQGVTVQYTLMK